MYTYKATFKNGTVKTFKADSRFFAYDNALEYAKRHYTDLLYLD